MQGPTWYGRASTTRSPTTSRSCLSAALAATEQATRWPTSSMARPAATLFLGLGGDDTIRGGGGRDTIDGGAGADLIDGGVGKDTLTGGTDRDVFQFRDGDFGATRGLADVITDFSHADAEKIQLNLVDANTATAGNQAFTFIGAGTFTGVAGQLHYAYQAGNTYVEGDTNGDGTADFVIALTGTHVLVASDFVL